MLLGQTSCADSSQRLAEMVLGRLALDHPSPCPGAPPVVPEPQHREAALALRTAPLRLPRTAKIHHPPRVVFTVKDQNRVSQPAYKLN